MKKTKKIFAVVITALLIASVLLTSCGSKQTEDNRIKKETVYDSDNTVYSITDYNYDSYGNLSETVEKIYDDGEVIEESKLLYTYVNGLAIRRELFYFEDGKYVKSYEHEYGYDKFGGEVVAIGYDVEEDVKILFALDLTEYNDDGRVMKSTSYLNDEKTGVLKAFNEIIFTYNEKGQLVKEDCYYCAQEDEELTLDYYYTYEYNDKGERTTEKWCNADGSVKSTLSFTYGDNGNLIRTESFEEIEGIPLTTYRADYEYSNGNLVKETRYYVNEQTGVLEMGGYTVYEY